jgi:hypothetical protein
MDALPITSHRDSELHEALRMELGLMCRKRKTRWKWSMGTHLSRRLYSMHDLQTGLGAKDITQCEIKFRPEVGTSLCSSERRRRQRERERERERSRMKVEGKTFCSIWHPDHISHVAHVGKKLTFVFCLTTWLASRIRSLPLLSMCSSCLRHLPYLRCLSPLVPDQPNPL